MGIWPINKAQVMSHLSGNINNESTSELVSQSFIETRGVETNSAAPQAKRRKVSCAPGKSLSANDIPAPVSSSVSSSRKATKVTRPTPGISAESQTDEETRSSTTGTTSAASSGRSDDSDVESDTGKSSAGKLQLTEGIYVIVQYERREYPGEVIQAKKCGAKIILCQVSTMMKFQCYSKPFLEFTITSSVSAAELWQSDKHTVDP